MSGFTTDVLHQFISSYFAPHSGLVYKTSKVCYPPKPTQNRDRAKVRKVISAAIGCWPCQQ